MTELVLAIPPSVDLTEKGLVFHGRVSLQEYLGLGKLLFIAKDELQFAIGDLIVHGQDFIGESWTQMLEDHYAEQSIANLASICRRVGHDVRRPHEASMSMHEVIAPFHETPELQTALLDAAIKNGWRRNEFRDFVAPLKAKIKGGVSNPQIIGGAVEAFNAGLSSVESPPFDDDPLGPQAPKVVGVDLPPRGNGLELEQILLAAFDANSKGDSALVSELLDKAIQKVRGQ